MSRADDLRDMIKGIIDQGLSLPRDYHEIIEAVLLNVDLEVEEVDTMIKYAMETDIERWDEDFKQRLNSITPQNFAQWLYIKNGLSEFMGKKTLEGTRDSYRAFIREKTSVFMSLKDYDKLIDEKVEQDLSKNEFNPVYSLYQMLDKTARLVFEDESKGEIEYKGNKKQIIANTKKRDVKTGEHFVLAMVTFPDNATISAKLTAYDKLIYSATGSMWREKNEVFTITQLLRLIGIDKPNSAQIKRATDSIDKLMMCLIKIDTRNEGYNYPLFEYGTNLLHAERVTEFIGGKLAEGAVHLISEPILITFTNGRKTITRYDKRLWQAGISLTERNVTICSYLIERIAMTKKSSETVRFATVYEKCGADEKRKKRRARDTMERFLIQAKTIGFISDFEKTKTGYRIQKKQDTLEG